MEKYSRQEYIVPIKLIQQNNIAVIGVGAVGREVCRTLSANGAKNITIYDMDIVEVANCVTQGYYQDDIGKPKVECTKFDMERINNDCVVTAINDRWRPNKNDAYDTVFICVDSLSTREKIFNWYKKRAKLILDSRIGGEQIRLLSVFDKESREWFPKTIGNDADSYQVGCHVPMIKHSANIAASFLVQQFIASLTNKKLFKDRIIALPSGEMFDND